MTKLNDSPLHYLQSFDDEPSEIEPVYIKNCRWEGLDGRVWNPYFWNVLNTMYDNCPKIHRYLFIDIKVQDLTVGKNTANGHWHLDSSLIPDVDYHNQIFVSGINRTEFIITPLEIPVGIITSLGFNNYIGQQKDLEIVTIPDRTIVAYNGRNVHRGVLVTQAERRLLIRMINTDKQLPQN